MSVITVLISSVHGRKIKLRVFSAAGVKPNVAGRAIVAAGQVLLDAHLISTGAAQDRALSPFGLRPDFDWMISQSLVAILAGVIDAAAFHLYRDDVENGPIVSAARFCIQIDSANFRA